MVFLHVKGCTLSSVCDPSTRPFLLYIIIYKYVMVGLYTSVLVSPSDSEVWSVNGAGSGGL